MLVASISRSRSAGLAPVSRRIARGPLRNLEGAGVLSDRFRVPSACWLLLFLPRLGVGGGTRPEFRGVGGLPGIAVRPGRRS